ncbi:MAG: hypothetical protein IJN45_08855 [Alistipes sp.]|nr:hypothetical protein [Alistipes sp.]MBQ6989237.1 hypothetical protein [Alistipes sp.]
MNVLQSLRSLSSYPIPTATIEDVAEGVGLAIDTELTQELRKDKRFKRAQARVYMFLSEAPNVSQGGISYSFSEEERRRFRLRAENLLEQIGDATSEAGVEYGYKGEDL